MDIDQSTGYEIFTCTKYELSELGKLINSLWLRDAIWRHRPGSTLVRVMAWWLTAPSHCPNQYWLIINNVPWHSSKGIILRSEDTNQWNKNGYLIFKIASRFPRSQWVSVFNLTKHTQFQHGDYNKKKAWPYFLSTFYQMKVIYGTCHLFFSVSRDKIIICMVQPE